MCSISIEADTLMVNIIFHVLIQKSVVRKKYATRDEDLFSDSTDIFADIPAPRSSDVPASSADSTSRGLPHPLPNNEDDDGDYVSG